MLNSAILGLILGFYIVFFSISKTNSENIFFTNQLALLLVLGGTISVGIMTYGAKRIANVLYIFFNVYKGFR